MGILAWLSNHWLDLLSATGGPGLCLTAYALWQEAKARRNGNAIAIAQKHSELLRDIYSFPELKRAISESADSQPVPTDARVWLVSMILHLSLTFHLMKDGEFINLEGLQKDVKDFFSLPIPSAVWKEIRSYQNKDFVDFFENCLNSD